MIGEIVDTINDQLKGKCTSKQTINFAHLFIEKKCDGLPAEILWVGIGGPMVRSTSRSLNLA